MTLVRVVVSPPAARDLRQLDRQVVRRILSKVEENTKLPDPLVRAKALSGNLSGLYRYRIGDHRVIFDVTPNKKITIYTVITVKHRKDVYR